MSAGFLWAEIDLILVAGLAAFGVLWLIGRTTPVSRSNKVVPVRVPHAERFLFRDELLIDHNANALPEGGDNPFSWQQFHDWFATRFPDLPARLGDLPDSTQFVCYATPPDTAAPAPKAMLIFKRQGRATGITLSDPPHIYPSTRHALILSRAQAADSQQILRHAPYPTWKTDSGGAQLWQNLASAELGIASKAAAHDDDTPTEDGKSTTRRISISGPHGPLWYEIHATRVGLEILHYATNVTDIVRAQSTHQDLVQTLSKTFAYLNTGLAVFDRQRQLALFNPILLSLTSLSAEFLSGRPDVNAFFDKLRDQHVMPEPRDYASWRTQITQLVSSARDGFYQETWSMPNDVTYRVTGRPHPDGAVGFFFEDISTEVLKTRRYRLELGLHQSTIDLLSEAVLVIGNNNALIFCNRSAKQILQIDPDSDSQFSDMTLANLISVCARALPAPDLWHKVQTALQQHRPTPLRLAQKTGQDQTVTCRVDALPGGAKVLILSNLCAASEPDAVKLASL